MKPAHKPHHTPHHASSFTSLAAWGARALMPLCLFAALAVAVPGGSLHAQAVKPQPVTTDDDEVMLSPSAVRAAAQTPQPQTGSASTGQQPQQRTGATANEDDVIMLSPFVVNTDRDDGFVAAASLSGGRLGGELKDTPVAYSVLTGEFIQALGLTDMADMAEWLPNSAENRNAGDTEWSNRDFYLTSRGASANRPQRDFFPYSFNFDGYNIDRLDVGRGPNSILFGNSSYASTPNAVSKRARTDKQFTEVALSYGSWDNYRATLDYNMPLSRSLALRLNALYVDSDSWMHHDFLQRKAVTLAGTWRAAKNTELRFEAERGDKRKAALGNHYDDFFSAWSGTHTYSAAAASNPAAGIVAQSSNTIVYTPTSGENYLVNYQGWARTNGGNASSSYTAGGYEVQGELGNIYNQPIANRINLPPDLYAIAEANSFFKVPSRKDVAYVDGPLYHEKYYNYTLAATQRIGQKFFAEAAVNFVGLESGGEVGVSGLGRLYIDVNSKLPDGRNNPNFLQPYGEMTHRNRIIKTDNINARLSMAYVLDNTRFGSFRFNAMGGYSRAETKTDRWTYALTENEDHRYWPTEKQVLFRYYHNDKSRPYDFSDRKWLYLDRNATMPRMVEAAEVRGTNESASGNSEGLTEYSYMQYALDAKFFKKRLNFLAALRTDSYRARRRDSVPQYDYPKDWNGRSLVLKPDAPADWATLTYQPLDSGGNPEGPVLPAEVRPRITQTTDPLYGQGDPRYDGVRFQDDYNSPEIKDTVTTYSLGTVFHVTQSISVFANYAESFVPLTTNFSIEGNMLGAQSGDGRDIGLRLTTPGNKFVANLIRYRGFDRNALSASVASARTYIANIINANVIGDNSSGGMNQRNLGLPPSGINDTVTKELDGYEIDITANLTRSWRLLINGSITDAYQTDTYHHMRRYLARHGDTLKLIVQDAGGVFIGDLATAGPVLSVNGDAAINAWNNLMVWRSSWTDERQKLDRLTERTANIFTDYAFRTGPLKGLRIGAGLNYRGRSVIGYRGGDLIEDPDNPGRTTPNPLTGPLDVVYQPGYTTARATIHYNWRINRKITINLSLIIRNLFDYDKPIYIGSVSRPVGGDLNSLAREMTPVNYRWIDPRSFTFTAALKF